MLVRPRAVVLAVFTVAATLLALRVLESAGRILGWVAMAAALAAVMTPAVSALAKRMPRGVAVAIVVLGTLAAIGGVVYGFVEDVVAQTKVLEREAPRLAAEIERDGPFAEAASEADLSQRVEAFVASVPERLRGGSPADAVRSAATRGLAFLAVTVLTIFMILHGPRLLDGAQKQIHDDDRRSLAVRLTTAIERRAVSYVRGSAVMAVAAGFVAFALATIADVPGAAPLGVWVALWDVVPLVGAFVGSFPIIVLAGVVSPGRGAALGVAFVAWQVIEAVFIQRPLERHTVHVGPFLTVAAGMAGLELYGIAGALLAILAAAIAVVVADEVAREHERVAQPHGDE